jgi:hypothetical protein
LANHADVEFLDGWIKKVHCLLNEVSSVQRISAAIDAKLEKIKYRGVVPYVRGFTKHENILVYPQYTPGGIVSKRVLIDRAAKDDAKFTLRETLLLMTLDQYYAYDELSVYSTSWNGS